VRCVALQSIGKDELKELLRKVRTASDVEEFKPMIKEVLGKLNPAELALAEQELMAEGISVEEIRKLCEPHIELLREGLVKRGATLDQSHPIQILMGEHEVLLQKIETLRGILEKQVGNYSGDELSKLDDVMRHLIEAESHHKREEEALFPELEGRGVTGPPKVMRMEHEEFRAHRRALKELLDNREKFSYEHLLNGLREHGGYIVRNLENHIFKENNILYPTALQVLKEDDWVRVRGKFDETGYCSFTPGVRGK
jgi:DUF438 domain-containing protein